MDYRRHRQDRTVRAAAGVLVVAALLFGPTEPAGAQDTPQEAPVSGATVTQPAPAAVTPAAPAAPSVDFALRGIDQYRRGNYEEALEDLAKARLIDPQSSMLAYYQGATLKRMQQYTKALPPLRQAVELQPAVTQAFLELADVYFVLGRDDAALHAIEVSEREGIEPAQTAFLKGLILVKKRQFADAVRSFEKAKSLDAAFTGQADFQIASIYHREGKQSAARDLFAAVAAADPESDVGQMAKQQADALSRRLDTGKRFSATASAQLLYDSNVMLKPDNAASAAAITNESDMAAVVTARAEYAAPVPQPWTLKLQYALHLSFYQDLTQFDIQSHTIGITPGTVIKGDPLNLLASYNMTKVDGQSYLQSAMLSPVYVLTPGQDQQAHLMLRYQQKDFRRPVTLPDEDRDSTEVAGGVSWYWLVAQQKGFVNVKAEVNREDAVGRNWTYQGIKAAAGGLYPVTETLKLALGIEAYRQDYTNTNSSFGVTREDTTTTFTAQALYALTRSVDGHVQFVAMKDDSSIPVYAFTKNMFSIGVFARF